MFLPVDTRQPRPVLHACLEAWRGLETGPDPVFLEQSIQWLADTFAGRHAEFEPLDTPYHDLEHTLQGTLCLSRLLAAWTRNRTDPVPDALSVRLATLAILFHDSGYLKARGDHHGTGAKHTRLHVERSTRVAGRQLAVWGHLPGDIEAVQNMIRCTGTLLGPASLPFRSTLHRRLGAAVGAADLLCQMAAPDYPEKLPHLHAEFLEASRLDPHPGSPPPPPHPEALLEQTPAFWLSVALPRLHGEFGGIHHHLNQPWPDGENPYIAAIEANIARIAQRFPAPTCPASSNFSARSSTPSASPGSS